MEDEPNMVVYAVPCNTPIIISEDKVEEFLNIKPDEEARERREKMLEKYKYIVTDNTEKYKKDGGIMNKDQKTLYEALTLIANCTMTVDDGIMALKKLNKNQILKVIDKFSNEITEFDDSDLLDTLYNFDNPASTLIFELQKIKDEKEE